MRKNALIGAIASSRGYDISSLAYFAAVPDSFSTARKDIINTLVVQLKSIGAWSKLDRLWLMANTTSGNALVSLVNPGSTAMSLVNAPTFTTDRGFAGDGATSYIDTNFVPSTDAVNYLLDDAEMFLYCRTNAAANTAEMGVDSNANNNCNLIITKFGDGNYYAKINNQVAGNITNPITSSLGLLTIKRTSSLNVNFLQNGSSLNVDTSASTALPMASVYICAHNSAAPLYSTKQIALAGLSAGSINDAAFYKCIQTYMTAIGAQV